MALSRYIDGSRNVYWNDSNGNLTIPGTLTAGNIEGASFSLGPSVQFSSIQCSSINAGSILNGSNTSYLSYTNNNAPASDGTVNGINVTALERQIYYLCPISTSSSLYPVNSTNWHYTSPKRFTILCLQQVGKRLRLLGRKKACN